MGCAAGGVFEESGDFGFHPNAPNDGAATAIARWTDWTPLNPQG
jgi:hypothetical protein